MPVAWGYVRVSDQLQLGRKALDRGKVVDDTSLATQKRMILKWWDENKHLYPDHTFAVDKLGNPAFWEDPAQSGRHVPLAQRPQGSRMLAAVGQGDIIIVWEMSRVFRNTVDALTTLSRLKSMGVTFEPLRGPKPSWKSAEDRFNTTVLAAVNELSADHISERCRDAWNSREEAGLICGNFVPLGWKKTYSIDPDTGRVLKGYAICKRERWYLRIFRWMRKLDPEMWTRDNFERLVDRYELRRGAKGKGQLWDWFAFRLSEFIVENDYPLKQLTLSGRGYRRDRISAEVVPVRKRSARATPRASLPVAQVTAEALQQAPPWTSVWKLRRQLGRLQAQLAAAEAAQQPDS